jgi:N-acetylmuramoyl-L-alanine amidase
MILKKFLPRFSLTHFLFFAVIVLMPVFKVNAAATTPIKILLVPGHDNEVWGSQYGNRKEADMNLVVATLIYNLLKKDKKFKVYITRDLQGYTQEFSDYFSLHRDEILAFKQKAKSNMQKEITNGSFIQKENPPHHNVSSDISLKLYGINKWADENKMDAVIHIHFNDYPRPNNWTIGKYTGFNIYIPDGQFANARESGQLAANIFTQLHKKYSTSTYPSELGGLTRDQKLIAIGSNGTLDASVRSILIEYGYIYEKKFRSKTTRLQAYANEASLTVAGIKKYFKYLSSP